MESCDPLCSCMTVGITVAPHTVLPISTTVRHSLAKRTQPLVTRRHWPMEVDLSSPVLDVVAPRGGTPLSLSLPPSHMNSVTWADLQTEPGGRLGREV